MFKSMHAVRQCNQCEIHAALSCDKKSYKTIQYHSGSVTKQVQIHTQPASNAAQCTTETDALVTQMARSYLTRYDQSAAPTPVV